VATERAIRYGKRAPEIVEHAEEMGADLIVLSSHRVDREEPGLTWATISYKVAIL
ncbi:MAG: universal stress protein, partial [Gammaproteobacteria bacterium]|nr:universal stress protein [Gemmatimonadota bacterium]NIU77245.1 universal stress protein [Gammaproteobacteria bacterium]